MAALDVEGAKHDPPRVRPGDAHQVRLALASPGSPQGRQEQEIGLTFQELAHCRGRRRSSSASGWGASAWRGRIVRSIFRGKRTGSARPLSWQAPTPT